MKERILLFFLLTFSLSNTIFSQTCEYITDHNNKVNSTQINCGFNFINRCVNLTSNFPILKDTNGYITTELSSYQQIGNFNSGTPLNANEDDQFIKRVNLETFSNEPFFFSFFGKKRNSFIVSTNGFISFDEDLFEGDFSTPNIGNFNIPSSNLPPISVYGIYQDLQFTNTSDSEIYLNVIGTYPCRKIIINFYKGIIAGTDQTSTFQIVLHEGTSSIQVNILDKPIPDTSARYRNSLIGLVDERGNGIAAPNRNNGIWNISQQSFQFSPNGQDLSPSSIRWTNSINNTSSDGAEISVCNITPSIYTATGMYTNSNGETFYLKDSHQIILQESYPIKTNYTEVICSSNPNLNQNYFYSKINLQINPNNFRYKFYLTERDAINNESNYIPSNQNLIVGQTYFVRIENGSNESCYEISKLIIPNSIEFPQFVEICDTGNDRQEEYILANLNCQLFDGITNVSNIQYFINGSSTPSTTALLNSDTRIQVRYQLTGCGEVTSSIINVRFKDSPIFTTNEVNFSSYDEIFDVVSDRNPFGQEPFNWARKFRELGITITNDPNAPNFRVYQTYNDAVQNINPLDVIKEGNPDLDYRYTLYIRLQNNNTDCRGNCYNILTVNARVKFRKIVVNVADADTDVNPDNPLMWDTESADVYLCEGENYNLNYLADVQRLFRVTTHNINNLRITFHENNADANNFSSVGVSPNFTTTGNQMHQILVRLMTPNSTVTNFEYVVKPLRYHFLPRTSLKAKIDICVDFQINEKELNLNSYVNQIIPQNILNLQPRPLIKFYTDQALMQEITQLIATRDYKKVWVKITYPQAENNCELINEIEFKLVSNENILKPVHEVQFNCDNNYDQKEIANLEEYITEFVANPDNYEIGYFLNYNPNNNSFSNPITSINEFEITATTTIYIRIQQIGMSVACPQKLELKLIYNINSLLPIRIKEEAFLLRCNESNATLVSFNLSDAIEEVYFENFNPPFQDFITDTHYYLTYEDALENLNPIDNWEDFTVPSTQPNQTIYIKFINIFGCYSITKIHLRIPGLIKLRNNIEANVCDTNLDGIYTFDFREWINNAVQDDDTSNDLLTDQTANRYAEFKIYLNMNDYLNNRPLTSEQERNFILDPTIHQNLIISASLPGGCLDYITFRINYAEKTTSEFTIPAICDENNDGVESVDLTQFETNFPNAIFEYYRSLVDLNNENNRIENPTNYSFNVSLGNTIFFKIIENNEFCPNLGTIDIQLKTSPKIEIEDVEICVGDVITITPNYKTYNIIAYEWKNAQGEIISTSPTTELDEVGNYSLTITESNGCTFTEEFTISYYDVPTIIEIRFQSNNASVIASGNKPILYSMDAINWQTSNLFNNLTTGVYDFYIKYEENPCIIGPKKGLLPMIHNSITPNGDGINDYWTVKNLDVFDSQNAKLEIFDRFGKKLFSQESNTYFEWNGKLNDTPLPSTSYWYTIVLPDGRNYSGYINVLNKTN